MKTSLLFLVIFLSGCSFLNPLFYEEGFKKYADRIVGLDAEKYTTYPYVKLEKVVELDDGHREYFISTDYETSSTGDKSTCHWVLITMPSSSIVNSWRYNSEPSECKGTYFHEGAW
ncbi:hypothetical protein [Arsukibacterium sp. UBA3155]|uniref:hypothetical protein n=1 Tax=Arsukibacterium sp. UBA3155 TaxID=1946058 RepID=UPI0025BA6F85|nr:hypothetical protein [Arsukibacterium sp. UBA3155]